MDATPADGSNQQNRLVGWLGVGLSITGLVVPVLVAAVWSLVDPRNVMALCLILFGALEVAALGCGIVARRERAGLTALTISASSLVLVGLAVILFMPSEREKTEERSRGINKAIDEAVDQAFDELGTKLDKADK